MFALLKSEKLLSPSTSPRSAATKMPNSLYIHMNCMFLIYRRLLQAMNFEHVILQASISVSTSAGRLLARKYVFSLAPKHKKYPEGIKRERKLTLTLYMPFLHAH